MAWPWWGHREHLDKPGSLSHHKHSGYHFPCSCLPNEARGQVAEFSWPWHPFTALVAQISAPSRRGWLRLNLEGGLSKQVLFVSWARLWPPLCSPPAWWLCCPLGFNSDIMTDSTPERQGKGSKAVLPQSREESEQRSYILEGVRYGYKALSYVNMTW